MCLVTPSFAAMKKQKNKTEKNPMVVNTNLLDLIGFTRLLYIYVVQEDCDHRML